MLLSSICGYTQESIEAETRVIIEEKASTLNRAYYIPSLGDSVTIHKLQFYIGSGDPLTYTLVDLADSTSTYIRLPYPQGDVLKIVLSIDSLTNVSGAQGGALDPMHGLYWTWNSEYINFKLEGTSPICSTPKNKFQLHLGSFIAPHHAMKTRTLFYDPILSYDNSISYASCHSPYNAFGHTDHDLSHGIRDSIGTRNAPALYNLAWSESFMWDGAIQHLDMQALAPISHPSEMGSSIETVLKKLNSTTLYNDLSLKAFSNSTLTGKYVLKALSQFQLTFISANSKNNDVKSGEASFTSQELNGYRLFKKHCSTCHQEPLFHSARFKNNGLEIDTTHKNRVDSS